MFAMSRCRRIGQNPTTGPRLTYPRPIWATGSVPTEQMPMSKSTTFTCPNCDHQQSVVLVDGGESATITCPNCDEQIVVSFGTH